MAPHMTKDISYFIANKHLRCGLLGVFEQNGNLGLANFCNLHRKRKATISLWIIPVDAILVLDVIVDVSLMQKLVIRKCTP